MSESGTMIGIACSFVNPALSVMFPGTKKSEKICSSQKYFQSAIFVNIAGKEKLVANCYTDLTVRIWDLETGTSKIVMYPVARMNLCVIDDTTIACGEVKPSADGGPTVLYIFNIDDDQWSCGSTVHIKDVQEIHDMCFLKTSDGTPCLLLCCPDERCVQAVEMVGGKPRWKTDVDQMGSGCFPWNICTDISNRV